MPETFDSSYDYENAVFEGDEPTSHLVPRHQCNLVTAHGALFGPYNRGHHLAPTLGSPSKLEMVPLGGPVQEDPTSHQCRSSVPLSRRLDVCLGSFVTSRGSFTCRELRLRMLQLQFLS